MQASYPAGSGLAELLSKGEIPAAILKYCFASSLFIWDKRVTHLTEISAKRAGILAIGELTIGPCKHFFPGYLARWDKILLKACVLVLNLRAKKHKEEGKKAFQVVWWNAFITISNQCLTSYKVSWEFIITDLSSMQTFLKCT